MVVTVDKQAGDDALQRFILFLNALLRNMPKGNPFMLYFDNMESLLETPEKDRGYDASDPAAFASWRDDRFKTLWATICDATRQVSTFYLLASCRYSNDDFTSWLCPVSPLPPDAIFRLMSWFDALRLLPGSVRAGLVQRLEGHPRAVEFLNDLVQIALYEKAKWGEQPPTDEAQWRELVDKRLPEVEEKLRADLLLAQLWDKVLTGPQRAMLARMSLLRRPCERSLFAVLGEPEEGKEEAEATALALMRTSLLEQVDLATTKRGVVRFYTLHPATRRFVMERFGQDEAWLKRSHLRIGEFLEGQGKRTGYIETGLEAGYHLFQAEEFDRSSELLGSASDWLRNHGRFRESLQTLLPFSDKQVQQRMDRKFVGWMLGTVGIAYANLGEIRKAIGYYEKTLMITREIGDRLGEGAFLGNLGIAYIDLGEMQKAIRCYEQSLAITRETGDRRSEGNTLGNLGAAYIDLGEIQKAIEYNEQFLSVAYEIGDLRGKGKALGNLSAAYMNLGEIRKAIGYYEQVLAISREIRDRQGEGIALGNLGIAYMNLGKIGKAIEYNEQFLSITREIGDRRGEGNALYNMAIAYAQSNEHSRAISLGEQALKIMQETEDPNSEKVRQSLEQWCRGEKQEG